MKGINRVTIHHLNMEKLHILETRKNIFGFSSFTNFYLILVIQIFIDFLDFVFFYKFSSFCKFLFYFMKGYESGKGIEFDTNYLLWGFSPKLDSNSLLLVGIKPNPTVVSPPLL